MSFCIPVPHFLQNNRMLLMLARGIERLHLHAWGFCLLIGAFPFFQLSQHPTILLLSMYLLVLGMFIILALCREEILLDGYDLLVLAFLFWQMLIGVAANRSLEHAVVVSVLLSVWFPARRFWEAWGEKRLVFFSSLSLLVASALGVGQYAFGKAELRWVDVTRFGDIGGRVTSFFSNPNIFAIYLLLCFPLPLWAAFQKVEKGRARLFYITASVLCAGSILLTWSRGAWLGLFVQCLLFLLCYSKKSRRAIAWLLPIVLLSIPLLPHSFQNRLFSIADVWESSNRYRLQTWQGTWRMIYAHPFGIGIGEEAWRAVYPRYAVMGTATVPHAHNVFLQVVAEVGWVGLLLFAVLVVLSIRKAFRQRRFAAVSALLGALVMGMFDHLWYFEGMLLLFATTLAFCTSGEHQVTKKGHFVDILHEN